MNRSEIMAEFNVLRDMMNDNLKQCVVPIHDEQYTCGLLTSEHFIQRIFERYPSNQRKFLIENIKTMVLRFMNRYMDTFMADESSSKRYNLTLIKHRNIEFQHVLVVQPYRINDTFILKFITVYKRRTPLIDDCIDLYYTKNTHSKRTGYIKKMIEVNKKYQLPLSIKMIIDGW